MPIEVDLKRDAMSPKAAKGKVNVEEIVNEIPPFSAVSHINIDNVQFVIKLCPGRHNPDQPRKQKEKKGADGKAIKPPKPCKNDLCNIRTRLIDVMMDKTLQMKARMQEILGQLDFVNEERLEAESELEIQKKYLQDSEARFDILKSEEKECQAVLEGIKQSEHDGKNKVLDLEAERQRLARIVFENKLKQQGVELMAFDGDGLTLQPSKFFNAPPGDFEGQPKDDFVDRSLHKPENWNSLETMHLPERVKVGGASRKGVRARVAMVRPMTCPPACDRNSATMKAWEAQARVLPQPSAASKASDESTVRRSARTDLVRRVTAPRFDARATIAAAREEELRGRSQSFASASVYSWRDAAFQQQWAPGGGLGGGGGSTVGSPVGARGKFAGSGSISLLSSGSPTRQVKNLPALRALNNTR